MVITKTLVSPRTSNISFTFLPEVSKRFPTLSNLISEDISVSSCKNICSWNVFLNFSSILKQLNLIIKFRIKYTCRKTFVVHVRPKLTGHFASFRLTAMTNTNLSNSSIHINQFILKDDYTPTQNDF